MLRRLASRTFSSGVKIPATTNLTGYISKYQREGYRIASNINPLFANPNPRSEFELDHWQLSDMDSLSQFPLDYRVTSEVEQQATFFDLK